jgi:hypothetical protein
VGHEGLEPSANGLRGACTKGLVQRDAATCRDRGDPASANGITTHQRTENPWVHQAAPSGVVQTWCGRETKRGGGASAQAQVSSSVWLAARSSKLEANDNTGLKA